MKKYALIGGVAILGVILATIYVQALDGNQATIIGMNRLEPTAEERKALEEEALEIALSDPRVKPLVEGKESKISASFKMTYTLRFVDNKTETYYAQWDGKYRASVYIRYPDDTGYGFDVNITDKVVEEPRKVVWEDGEHFKYLTP